MELRGKGALVTGASKGLGAALAAELARAGARVALVARGEPELQRAAERIRAAGGEAHALPADVGDKRAVHGIAGAAAALVGPIELLVHNASTLGPVPLRLLLDTECEDLERVLQTNLIGPFRLSKIVAGAMALRGSGLIVHVSSDAAVAAYPRWGAYSVSKAAQDHLSRIWAAELQGTGVRALSVDPGEMDTEMHAAAMPEADRASLLQPAQAARQLMRVIANAERIESGAHLLLARMPRDGSGAAIGPRRVADDGDELLGELP
jgi:NAD(P)-dependent dehydrogenase (short-subunit alcohol dehydrogenase family)